MVPVAERSIAELDAEAESGQRMIEILAPEGYAGCGCCLPLVPSYADSVACEIEIGLADRDTRSTLKLTIWSLALISALTGRLRQSIPTRAISPANYPLLVFWLCQKCWSLPSLSPSQ